jgi:hypothetical protein
MAVGILLLVEVACLRPRPGGIRHNALIDGSPPVEQRPLPVTVDRPPFPFTCLAAMKLLVLVPLTMSSGNWKPVVLPKLSYHAFK